MMEKFKYIDCFYYWPNIIQKNANYFFLSEDESLVHFNQALRKGDRLLHGTAGRYQDGHEVNRMKGTLV